MGTCTAPGWPGAGCFSAASDPTCSRSSADFRDTFILRWARRHALCSMSSPTTAVRMFPVTGSSKGRPSPVWFAQSTHQSVPASDTRTGRAERQFIVSSGAPGLPTLSLGARYRLNPFPETARKSEWSSQCCICERACPINGNRKAPLERMLRGAGRLIRSTARPGFLC